MVQTKYLILGAGWLVWIAPFLIARRRGSSAAVAVDRRARWGMLLQGVAYMILWQGKFWLPEPSASREISSSAFFVLAAILSWTGVRALGPQWRVDAGLNAEHHLVRGGPYRVVRHPIYTSMLCILLAMGCLLARWPQFAVAALLFLVGTETRIRVEERLLAARFGDDFTQYRRAVPGYIPLLR